MPEQPGAPIATPVDPPVAGSVRTAGDHRRARPDGRSRRRRTAARRWLPERGGALRDAPRSRAGQSSRSSVRRRARSRPSRARVPDGERPVARASSVESNPATYRRASSTRSSGSRRASALVRSRSSTCPAGSVPGVARVGQRKLDDRPAPSTTDKLTRLVGRNGHQPWAQPIRLPQAAQLAPDDWPGRLDRLIGDVEVAADHETDPGHVVVVGLDDPREGSFVAGGSERHRPDELVLRLDRHRRHTPQMLGGGSSDSYRPGLRESPIPRAQVLHIRAR